jgi:hypothetical protein
VTSATDARVLVKEPHQCLLDMRLSRDVCPEQSGPGSPRHVRGSFHASNVDVDANGLTGLEALVTPSRISKDPCSVFPVHETHVHGICRTAADAPEGKEESGNDTHGFVLPQLPTKKAHPGRWGPGRALCERQPTMAVSATGACLTSRRTTCARRLRISYDTIRISERELNPPHLNARPAPIRFSPTHCFGAGAQIRTANMGHRTEKVNPGCYPML